MAGKRWDMTDFSRFPQVDEPLGEREGTVKNEWEKDAFLVMPDVGEPEGGRVGGKSGEEGGEGEGTEAVLGDRKRGGQRRDDKPRGRFGAVRRGRR